MSFFRNHFCEEKFSTRQKLTKEFKSFTVTVFSIFAFIVAALNILAINQTGVTASRFRDLAYIISALLVSLGIVGLYSVHLPHKEPPRKILIAFWLIIAFAVTALSVWEFDMLLTTKKAEAKSVCQDNLLIWDSDFNSGQNDPKGLAKVVDECYLFVMLAAGLELVFQIVGTMFGVIIAVRYHRKLTKHLEHSV
ncbi:hypothetical protein BGZ46_002418 [Entomortierella lignicola]|nr:hypothetical protein BGZ46_002418 [Entomortierella lignicola]